MGVRILHDRENEIATIYCSTVGWSLGPLFEGPDADTDAEAFLIWLGVRAGALEARLLGIGPHHGDGRDARHWHPDHLRVLHYRWSSYRDRRIPAAALPPNPPAGGNATDSGGPVPPGLAADVARLDRPAQAAVVRLLDPHSRKA